MALKDHEGQLDQKTGQFLPGNQWKMPPWRKGQSGHTARYQPNSLANKCAEYIQLRESENKPLTWSGLALHLGISRPALDKYAKGKIGKDKAGIVSVLEYMRSFIENQLEEKATDKDYATSGVIRLLEVMDTERFKPKDEIEMKVEEKERSTTETAARLLSLLEQARRNGDKLLIEEGEFEEK